MLDWNQNKVQIHIPVTVLQLSVSLLVCQILNDFFFIAGLSTQLTMKKIKLKNDVFYHR